MQRLAPKLQTMHDNLTGPDEREPAFGGDVETLPSGHSSTHLRWKSNSRLIASARSSFSWPLNSMPSRTPSNWASC